MRLRTHRRLFLRELDRSRGERFDGQFYHGEGDAEYLKLLDIARRMYSPDPEFQNIGMF